MITKQVWKIGDCLELLPEIPDKSVNMILTDMPYGTTACEWDKIINLESLWLQYERIIKDNGAIVLTSNQPFTIDLIQSNRKLYKYCWYFLKSQGTNYAKANKMPLRIVEDILIFYKNLPVYNPIRTPRKHAYLKRYSDGDIGSLSNRMTSTRLIGTERIVKDYTPVNVLCFKKSNLYGHDTEKPLALFEYLIKTYTNEGDTVHDSCLGSGTTLEACMNLNRNCMGFEIDPQWEPIYRKRLKLDNTKLDAFNTSACPKSTSPQ